MSNSFGWGQRQFRVQVRDDPMSVLGQQLVDVHLLSVLLVCVLAQPARLAHLPPA